MKLQISKSKNSSSLYVTKSFRENGKYSSKVVEKLGTYDKLLKKLDGADPIAWAKAYVQDLNNKEKEEQRDVYLKFNPTKKVDMYTQSSYNGGYLFLQQIYYELGLHKICKEITQRNQFDFNLNSILSRLIYGRILYPASKLATNELSKTFIEQPDFDLHHIYRALSIFAKESDFIQSSLYKNSLKQINRQTGVVYYDCTNFFFEIEQGDGIKQHGVSKEHRPNPLVQMGLFMDADGLPLAFEINPGNTNEQITLQPLEKKLATNFGLSKIVVCTDAGLSSLDNRKYNNKEGRAFITTQSLKKIKSHLKEWSLNPEGWYIVGDENIYNLQKLDSKVDYSKTTFYKDRWINEDNFEQRLIVTYSLKYKEYARRKRNHQIEKAQNLIKSSPAKLDKKKKTDYKRFIEQTHCTKDGEIAKLNAYCLDLEKIKEEEQYDGFYAVCTNLEDDAQKIIKVNHRRWEIEESFRIMKSEFKARPVYLQREDRIKAHFITCFLALMVYRMLEKKVDNRYSCEKLINTLSKMNFYKARGEGYIPTYTRTEITDCLHERFMFRTDHQIILSQKMKKIISKTKT